MRFEKLVSVKVEFPDLAWMFEELNESHFGGLLASPTLSWNFRMRTTAGRFSAPKRFRFFTSSKCIPTIEIAAYLMEEHNGLQLVRDTLGHEMIHYWLWSRGLPHGHTAEFWKKMTQMGVSRYNTVPRRRPHKYSYQCPNCFREYLARRKLGRLACSICCNRFTAGYYDSRFRLVLAKILEKPETIGEPSLEALGGSRGGPASRDG